MNKLIDRLKQIWNAPSVLANVQRRQSRIIEEQVALRKMIQERTEVHTDIHWHKSIHNVIVIGRYRNQDYVRLFDVEAKSFDELIDVLSRMERNAKIGRFDEPGNWPNVKAVIGRDRF